MKEKVIFILSIIGSFSATILIFLTEILAFAGVDTSGYVDILKMISMGLAGIILIVGMVFLNKYNAKQQIANTEQKANIQSILNNNTEFMRKALPQIATELLATTQSQVNELTKIFKDEMTTAMTEMLPNLAKQTMDIVTKESQDIIAKTTAKANDTMLQMQDLWPTYAKNISDQVAQTVRENNAHYHKMLNDIKTILPTIPTTPIQMPSIDYSAIEAVVINNLSNIEHSITESITKLLANLSFTPPVISDIVTDPKDDSEEYPAETIVEYPAETIVEDPEEATTQNDETSEESNETEQL